MNKVGLSLSILSLCGLLSTSGWAEKISYNNPLCCLSSKPATPPQNSQPTEETPVTNGTIIIPNAGCGQEIKITDSNGQITTIKTTCPPPPGINY